MSSQSIIEIVHKPSGNVIARGPKGWSMFPFEGNYYISKKNLLEGEFTFTVIPGICPYKFIYFWYHFKSTKGEVYPMLGWKYWLPNPLFPFVAFRLGIPAHHPELLVRTLEG